MKNNNKFKPLYYVRLSQYGLQRDLQEDILDSLESRDKRLFITNSYPYGGVSNMRELFFETRKKDIAQRLVNNLRKLIKAKRLRAGVKIEIY